MPLIKLSTEIEAPIEMVFDLARSIDFHQQSASKTGEKVVAGKKSGYIELNEFVTWEAIHFGIKQRLTTHITSMNKPHSFTDEMVKGIFKSIKHEHLFSMNGKITTMVDHFYFESPLGWLGKLFNYITLTNYMKRFLETRNAAIKKEAEQLIKES